MNQAGENPAFFIPDKGRQPLNQPDLNLLYLIGYKINCKEL